MMPEDFTRSVRAEVLSAKKFNKIFCVGYNKTGTTTLETVLRLYGYRLPNQHEQEIRITRQTFSTDYSEFCSFVNAYDAFQDMPFSQELVYVAADALFPNSKFILTVRDSEDWYRSLTSFHKKMFKVDNLSRLTEQEVYDRFKYLYPGYMHSYKARLLTSFDGNKKVIDWSKLYDKDYYISMYEQRNNMVRKYFCDAPCKLLVVDVTKERTTESICRFLNIPEKYVISMPHANKT